MKSEARDFILPKTETVGIVLIVPVLSETLIFKAYLETVF